MNKVRIDDIAAAIGSDSSEGVWYLDTESGTTELVTENIMEAAIDGLALPLDADEIPADIKLMYKLALEILHDDSGERFMKLPGQLDVLERDIMRRFAMRLDDSALALELSEVLQSANAFQAFQWRIKRHKLTTVWDEFRERALREIAIDWCTQHGIPFE